LQKVISAALQDAGFSGLSKLDDIELMGSGWRIPKILDFLGEITKDGPKLGQKLNGDESATFGAGFLAASLSTSFKVKPLYVANQSPSNYWLFIEKPIGETEDSKEFPYYVKIFNKYQDYPEPINITIKATSNFTIRLSEEQKTGKHIFLINNISVSENILKNSNVTLIFKINRFGLPEFIKGFYPAEEIFTENITLPDNTTQLINETKIINKTVHIKSGYTDFIKVSDISASIQKLDSLDIFEGNIKARAKAKNDYESIVYTSRNWLREDENQDFINQTEKQPLIDFLDNVFFLQFLYKNRKKFYYIQKTKKISHDQNGIKK